MLPDFLGIGCYRSGSTWLHDLLNAHPEAYVPQRRKEVHFFLSPQYERGIRWYESFFPRGRAGRVYKAVGEIGPGYLYDPECIPRIAAVSTIGRFLVMLRDPVERAYSHYRWRVRFFSQPPTFWEQARNEPRILEAGLYAKYLVPWIEAFGHDRFLILMLEQVRRNPIEARLHVAKFLALNPARFPSGAGGIVSNPGKTLARPALYHVAAKTYNWLIRHDLDPLIRPFRSAGKRITAAGGNRAVPALDDETRRDLQVYYERPNSDLAELLHLDIVDWQ